MTNENDLRPQSAEHMPLDRMRPQMPDQREVARSVRSFAVEQAGEICQSWGITDFGKLFDWAERIESFVRFGAGLSEANYETRYRRQLAFQQAFKFLLHRSANIDDVMAHASEIDAFIEHATRPLRLPDAPNAA